MAALQFPNAMTIKGWHLWAAKTIFGYTRAVLFGPEYQCHSTTMKWTAYTNWPQRGVMKSFAWRKTETRIIRQFSCALANRGLVCSFISHPSSHSSRISRRVSVEGKMLAVLVRHRRNKIQVSFITMKSTRISGIQKYRYNPESLLIPLKHRCHQGRSA